MGWIKNYYLVSTHSRPKAAGTVRFSVFTVSRVSTHSRPKAAGNDKIIPNLPIPVSTHSRPKVAGFTFFTTSHRNGFNTQPPEGGWLLGIKGVFIKIGFQHTAARRRLVPKARNASF